MNEIKVIERYSHWVKFKVFVSKHKQSIGIAIAVVVGGIVFIETNKSSPCASGSCTIEFDPVEAEFLNIMSDMGFII